MEDLSEGGCLPVEPNKRRDFFAWRIITGGVASGNLGDLQIGKRYFGCDER